MPRKNTEPERPPTMSWGRALPVLAIAVVFDLLRLMFEMFWFFGPVLAAAYCTLKVSGAVGTTVGGVLCGTAATALGALGFGPLEAFGVVMAIAVGIFGWLVVLLLLMMFNARIFKALSTSWLWALLGLGVSIIPIVGSIPMITLSVLRLYHAQIKNDKVKLKEWKRTVDDIRSRVVRAAQAAALAQQQSEAHAAGAQ